jgi:hypothetical protein
MSVVLVTYDLKTPGRIYTTFYDTLKSQGNWWHYLSTTWLIQTTKTPGQVYSALAPHITTNDLILVLPVTKPCFGWLPKDAWDWINAKIV